MKKDGFEVIVPGKFSALEEAILAYLYANPTPALGTKELTQELSNARGKQEGYDQVQYGIETLIVAGLVKGKRSSEMGTLCHHRLQLTPKGEAEAIKQKRRLKKIVFDIPRPKR